MKMRSLVAAVAVASVGLLASAAPSMAKPATTSVTWESGGGRTDPRPPGCYDPEVISDKDISNVVYTVRTVEMIDGESVEFFETIQVEFTDEEQTDTLVLEGEVTEIWVKSGNNKSGDGGLGDAHVPVIGVQGEEGVTCFEGGGGDPTND